MVGSIYGQIADKWPRLNTACCRKCCRKKGRERKRKHKGGNRGTKRKEEKKTVVAPSQVTNLVKTRAVADRNFWGAVANRELSPTSGIVKYDRLLVKWDENIGCRLYLAPRISSSRSYVAASFPSLLLLGTMRNHEMTMTIRLLCKSIFVSRSRSSFHLCSVQLFWNTFYQGIGGKYLFVDGPSVYPLIPFSRAASCFWFFRIPGAKRHFTDIANRITSPLNVLRDHCWDSLLATNEIETFSRGTDSCIILLSISIRRKIFWNNKRMTYEGSFRFW